MKNFKQELKIYNVLHKESNLDTILFKSLLNMVISIKISSYYLLVNNTLIFSNKDRLNIFSFYYAKNNYEKL
jgi:hypothetical protein